MEVNNFHYKIGLEFITRATPFNINAELALSREVRELLGSVKSPVFDVYLMKNHLYSITKEMTY